MTADIRIAYAAVAPAKWQGTGVVENSTILVYHPYKRCSFTSYGINAEARTSASTNKLLGALLIAIAYTHIRMQR